MANKIILKKSSVVGKVPLATDLEIGELAVNLADATLYSKDSSGTVISVGGGGSGDVVGPASSTDNALVRFDGTTGKLIQNSSVSIDDAGNIINPDSVQFSGTVPASTPVGTLWFDSSTDTLNLQQNAITQQIGEELYVYGKASSAISGQTILQAIYKTGTVGASGVIKFAPTVSGITDGGSIIGVATEDIATNGFGRVTNFGIVHGINTTGSTYGETWADGDDIWYNPTTGGLTKTKPSAPNIKVQVGTIINAGSGGSGSFQVLLNAGSVLGGTDSNVQFGTLSSGNLLVYDASAGYWKNAMLTAGTGIGVTNGAGSVTVNLANTAVTAGSYTYGSFTVDAQGRLTAASSGTAPVTSVGATAPIASSGGTTPTISISQASSTTNGYLSSTDWNTFNNKTSNTGTVTSVAMTVPTGLSVSGTPITTSGTLALSLTAGYSIPTTASQTNWDSAYTQRLQWDGGSTNLVAATGRTSLGGTTVGQNFFTLTNPTAITFPRINADNTVSALDAATFRTAIGAGTGSGTVTSVTGTSPVASSGGTTPAISLASAYGDTQNPYGSKTANYVLAAPNGIAGSPTFRAIVAADIPTLNQNTTGSAGSVANAVTFNNGGTGDASGTTYNGSAAKTISYNSVGAPSTTGTGASGTWGISISGNAATATTASNGGVTSVNGSTGAVTVSGGQFFGTAATKAIAYNANSISENITITAGNNGLSAGPITINTSYTVTVATGANWVIV